MDKENIEDKARELRKQYYREYYKKPENKERKKIAQKKYWEKKAAKIKEVHDAE